MALIAIEHPDVETPAGGPPLVSERAFKSVWQHKGWTKIEGSDREPPQELLLPDGSLDAQIRKAQQLLEEGRLAPPQPGEESGGQAALSSSVEGTEGAPVPDGGSEAVGGAPVAQETTSDAGTAAPATAASTKTRRTVGTKES